MNKKEISAFLQANGIPFAVTERKAVCNMEGPGDIAPPHPEWDAKTCSAGRQKAEILPHHRHR